MKTVSLQSLSFCKWRLELSSIAPSKMLYDTSRIRRFLKSFIKHYFISPRPKVPTHSHECYLPTTIEIIIRFKIEVVENSIHAINSKEKMVIIKFKGRTLPCTWVCTSVVS
ncbi:hypothetical protein MTR_1g113855 [Medicago truncatula]|uniref:Uncharacterized protein n=1 Tax=Medicago truncatula TaxID=3880 RepID=A0A072VRM7_MEDTR|nr:hypothetical protein MTR_1g113855 [Medicago truncatula]